MKTRFTRADYDLLPEGFPAQLVEGLLVKEPSPVYGHQYVAGRIYLALTALVGPERAAFAPSDVGIDEWNVYQPDVLAFRAPPPMDVRDVGVPLLAFEVLSPSTARRDRGIKRRRLVAAGAEVWLVDPATKTIEVHDASGAREAAGDQPISSQVLPGFALVPSQLFRPADAR